ncbi:hypothetical protein TUM18999_52160 [Pseudomonas tohonis]|uniref:Uncharacterized protein n=1 Tax=Pseudomonas tohonis TaxID=2725477 RepID=A0A6J4EC37_9PSED|nr:tetratricopeptide repeat protein [Pseudomonas tohonis]BCG27025.1 hypothetical protein TUM18999_52160 [Pseudomonas tohonis]GJN56077.1 hypothetical protein TUM20286_58290 [Pseudomonas tohonis]
MNKGWIPVLTVAVMLTGCATPQRNAIPVVDSGGPMSEQEEGAGGGYRAPVAAQQPQYDAQDAGVVVMVPGASGSSAQAMPAPSAPISGSISTGPITPGPIIPGASSSAPLSTGSYSMPSAPSGIPSSGSLAADEQLDGPVLALLTTAQQQQSGGDLNGASSSLERAQRIAPREPQVLYRLAEVRLAQGDAAQAEQLARRGLSLSNGRPALQAGLWELVAKSRERQGDPSGAAQARQRAKVSS